MTFIELIDLIKVSKNEFQLREHLKNYLDLRSGIRGLYEEDRIDIMYPNVIVETKKYRFLNKDNHIDNIVKEQLTPYIKKSLAEYSVLTDGIKIYTYKTSFGTSSEDILSTISLTLINQEDVTFNENNLNKVVNLIKGNEWNLTPFNLRYLFGNPQQNYFLKGILKKFKSFFENQKSLKVRMLYLDWEKLFKIASDERNKEEVKNRRSALNQIFDVEINEPEKESTHIFIMHNLFSVILKLLIFYVLKSKGILSEGFPAFNDILSIKQFMSRIEKGEIFTQAGIKNLVSYDHFSWYIDSHIDWDHDFCNIIFNLMQKINMLKIINTNYVIDYAEDLYINYVPKAIRHSFGEFFTPQWIAKKVVTEINEIGINDRVIDPTCGGGSFLIEVLKIKKNKNIKEIFSEIVGIDLNPLNVLLSKFNLVVNSLNLLHNETNVLIPVFVGDSSYVPLIEKKDNIDIIRYTWITNIAEFLDMPEIVLPLKFVTHPKFFDIIEELRNNIENIPINDNSKVNKIINNFIDKIIEIEEHENIALLSEEIKSDLISLIKKIINLHKEKMNSIWLFMFINYIYPFAKAPYDKIIGNPPWVRWSNLPDLYKEKIKKTLREKGLFSNDKNTGGVDLNIYALITYNALEYLLKKNGVLTFLLPDSSLKNKSLEGFRRLCLIEKGKLIEPIYIAEDNFSKEVSQNFVIVSILKN